MTSYNISELPTPYRSAGAPPLGAHEGTVTPPVPPTPTGLTYFSGASIGSEQKPALWVYHFDAAGGSSADKLFEKQVGDELSVTINGTTQTLAITSREEGEDEGIIYAEIGIGEFSADVPIIFICPQVEDGVWSYYPDILYRSAEEIPGGVTLVIADPS